MANNLKAEDLIEVLRECDYRPYSYSGRAMYGKSCVAVTVKNMSDALQLGVDLAFYLGRDKSKEIRPSHDSMGLDMVLYFRNIPWPEGIPSDEDEG